MENKHQKYWNRKAELLKRSIRDPALLDSLLNYINTQMSLEQADQS